MMKRENMFRRAAAMLLGAAVTLAAFPLSAAFSLRGGAGTGPAAAGMGADARQGEVAVWDVLTAYAADERDFSSEERTAEGLKSLGLFRGVSDTDFDLGRAPTRAEALTMLIRLLGKEREALEGSFSHPFGDVPEWADPYVGYGYENGLTNGISASEFGAGGASSAMYLSFVLRALGYSDRAPAEGGSASEAQSAPDFRWDAPYALAEDCGLIELPEGYVREGADAQTGPAADPYADGGFLRADVVSVSRRALSAGIKGSTDTLADRLMAEGAIDAERWDELLDSERQAYVRPYSQYPAPAEITGSRYVFDLADIDIPEEGAYVELNGNVPVFAAELFTDNSFEAYGELDSLGRCTGAIANVGTDLMPTQPRGSISSVRPSGWHLVRYDEIGSDLYLYNRCHLIARQLTGEDANERNLITGTRYMNVSGLLPFEIMVGDYVKSTGNHVLYRATPVFAGSELVCRGVHLEAASVEDGAKAIRFNVFCFNRQPGIIIDYKDGSSRSDGTWKPETEEAAEPESQDGEGGRGSDPDGAGGSGAGGPDSSGAGGQGAASGGGSGSGSSYIEYAAAAAAAAGIVSVPPEESGYVLNLNSKKFHYPDCKSVDDMSEKNKYYTSADREAIIEAGFVPCKICDP